MAILTTGRRLDADGKPIDGTGFDYDSEGPIAELLAQRIGPIASQPVTGEWGWGLVSSAMSNGSFERGVGVFPTGNVGPPLHYHPNYEERFEFVQGEFIFTLGKEEQRVRAGDRVIAKKNTPHTFRSVGEEPGVMIFETWPAARIGEVLYTLFGMAHEGKLGAKGQPTMLHGMVILSEYADDTLFTSPPAAVAVPMAKLLAPLARRMGHRASDARYLTPEFWAAHVEQPVSIPMAVAV